METVRDSTDIDIVPFYHTNMMLICYHTWDEPTPPAILGLRDYKFSCLQEYITLLALPTQSVLQPMSVGLPILQIFSLFCLKSRWPVSYQNNPSEHHATSVKHYYNPTVFTYSCHMHSMSRISKRKRYSK